MEGGITADEGFVLRRQTAGSQQMAGKIVERILGVASLCIEDVRIGIGNQTALFFGTALRRRLCS